MAVGGACERDKALLTLCLLSPQDMRKHVTMTLLDTEQSYVESLRTLVQVRPGEAWVPERSRSESGWLLDVREPRGPRLERNDRGAHHPS